MNQDSLSESSQGDDPPDLVFQDPWICRPSRRRTRRRRRESDLPGVDRALTLLLLRHYLSDEGRVLESIGKFRWTDLYESDCGEKATEVTMNRIKRAEPYQISTQLLDQLSKLEYTLEPSGIVVSNSDTIKFEPSSEDLDFLRTEQIAACTSTLKDLHAPGEEPECPTKSTRRGHVVGLVSEGDASRINSAMPLYHYDATGCSPKDQNLLRRLDWSARVPISQRSFSIALSKHDADVAVALNPSDLKCVDGTPVEYTITTNFADLTQKNIDHYLSGRKVGKFTHDHPGWYTPLSLPPPPTTPSTDYPECGTPTSICSMEGCNVNYHNDNNGFGVVEYEPLTVGPRDEEGPALE
ncbi:hypothetical protein I302_105154 [Kwoniella bestiolae CBS 10118]|uniref:Uncharacterized protein n=1 Tax=Kwoniella bestiolae CBS 10118 TaxID=1296100 RepID=A0A1B9FSC4_9TREE|nr:hypothetical protein I302_08442 [Kwoniella bestiolae CBS 10118]OCF21665.1 hypothetical protein I302_08442 [Kwoniella bestiolae CBS 10118]